ncbi:unnamed protein product [Ilex paraguariensis]|uniref:Ribosomal protein L34Ae n=1 Tax=Ilex paraguariensis TaxID=185542 RepID=A0ABC8UYC5_9AQUA
MISQDQILDFRHVVEVYELQTRGFEKGIDYKVGSVLHVDQAMEETEVHSCDDQSSMEYISSGLSSGTPTSDADMTRSSSSISGYISSTEEVEMNVYFPSVCSSNSPVMEPESNDENNGEEMDDFYNKYTERMKWFDVLNHDRTCGISAILSKQLTSPSSFGSIEAVHLSIPHIPWKKMAKKRLLKSLESDFEMVYVAQSCLSWEALHHQYTKVEALASSRSTNGVFYNNVAGRFQKFQILLERFMEDERSEGKRYWNYVQRRFSVKSLLQVPEVSGYMEEEKEGMNGEAMRVTEVLNAIENCVKAFWLYIKTDKRKPWWKIKSFLWTYPPVEDPSDLKLLADLTKTLQQKELRLKDLRGKKRCWVKRLTNPLGESQKKEILYAMIDMKLISMVLKMSLISTSQLKWCQEKLKNIEFKEGKVMRIGSPTLDGYMEEEKEGMNGEAMRVTEVLNAIENCVKAFWLYIKTDKRKPWWKIKSFLWTYPPVEDPSDLKLLADLTKTLQQKELRLKDLRGKKRCWVKRLTNPLGESQKKEILYAMIDMKLISMVLKMSLISTSQLKWCQEKLKNIEFKEGKVMRVPTGLLFPSS